METANKYSTKPNFCNTPIVKNNKEFGPIYIFFYPTLKYPCKHYTQEL